MSAARSIRSASTILREFSHSGRANDAQSRDAGQYARARAIEEQVVEARTGVLGEEHPDTLRAKANLASALGGMGELKQARVMEEQVLEGRVRALGEEHPDTLFAKSQISGR
jgi:hypothetical protein